MSEAGKGISSMIEKEFLTQDAEEIVKSALGKDAFERRDQLGALETTENEQADYEKAQELSSNLRSLWWKIENERAQIALQIDETSKRKYSGKLSTRQLKALNSKLDDLTGRTDILSEIQSIILDGKTPDNIVKAFDELANDYRSNLKNKDFLKASGDENIKKVSDNLKTAIGELANYRNQIKFINLNNNKNFMSESTPKEISSIINIQKSDNEENVGRIADDELARKMADKANKMHNEWKEEIKDASNKEINEAIGPAADRAMEDVFKKETGMEYEAAVLEAKEELKGTEDEARKYADSENEAVNNQAAGIKNKAVENNIINDGIEASRALNSDVINAKNDAEGKIGNIETELSSGGESIQGEVKEIKDEKIEAVKKSIGDKIKNIDGKIKILENSHGNPGDRRLYIAREADIDVKQLTPKDEGRQRLIILARRKAEKAGLQKVEEIANNSEIKNYDDLQNRLWDNYKSAKNEFSKKCDELDKEPKDSDRRKKLIEEKRDLQAKMQMAKDSVEDFNARIIKEREEKNKKRQIRNQKAVKSEPVREPQEPKATDQKTNKDAAQAAIEDDLRKLRQQLSDERKKKIEAGDMEGAKKLGLEIDDINLKISFGEAKTPDNKTQKPPEPVGEPSASGNVKSSSKKRDQLNVDEAEAKLKTNGPVYANESLSDDMLDDLERTRNNKKQRLDEEKNKEEKELMPGDVVKVKRSDGKIDDHWEYQGIDPQTGRAIVLSERLENGEPTILRKLVSLDELKSLNGKGKPAEEPKAETKGEEAKKEQSAEDLENQIKALQVEINEIAEKKDILLERHKGARGKEADELEKEFDGLTAQTRIKIKELVGLRAELSAVGNKKDSEKSQETVEEADKKEPVSAEATAGKEKTAEEILREKNIETYGGVEKLNQIFEDYKRLNELEDRGAYDNRSPLFSEWDALRVKLANINLEIIAKDRKIDSYKIQNKDGMIREYFDKKLEEPIEVFLKDIEKASLSVLAIRAATLIKYRNELKNCDWQGKDKYRDIPRKEYLETIKVLEQKIGILNGMLPKKEGVSPEAALKDLSIDDFKKIEKEPGYKGGLPAVIEGEKVRTEMTAEQAAKVESVLKKFDLTAEDAEKIEGFKDLSYGQRLLALDNLRQLTLRDVRIGAVEKQKEEAAKVQGFWKKMWTGIKKRYDIFKNEKSISQNLGKEDYAATLAQLAKGMKEFKTDVKEINGKLEFQYVSGLENLTPEQAAKVQKFNETASELSRMPMEWTADDSKKGFFRQIMDKAGLGQAWSPDDPTRSQYRRTGELNAEFQFLKQEVIQIIKQQKDADLKKGGVEKFDDLETQSHAMSQMLQIENLLRYNRAMNVNPEAEKALLEIKSAPLWKRALNNIATEKGIYFVAGWAARSASMTLLGTAGIVGGAAGMGGYMGYKRGKEFLRENDAMAQHKSFEETKKKRIAKYERAKQGKAESADKNEKLEKRIEDADVLARNLNNFVEYIKEEDDLKRRMDLSRRLRDRVKFVKDALDQGRINFGATGERAANLYELTDKLNNAVNCVEIYHPSTRHEADQWSEKNQSEVMEKLNRYLEESKIELDAERRKYLVKQLAKGAMYGAGFASAGMIARELFSHLDPHIFNSQGETDLGVRWISGSGSGKPFIGGIIGKHLHGEPGSGGGGDHLPVHEGTVPAGGGDGKIKSVIDRFNEDFRHHPEWKTDSLEQMKAVNNLQQQLESAGVKNPDALKGIIDSAKDQLNGDGKIFVGGGHQEAQHLSGIDSTGRSGGEHAAAAAGGARKAAETLAGVKHDALASAVEIASGKMNSVWKMIDHQLDQRGFFKGLVGTPEEIAAKKTYMIDYFKDIVAKDPKGFGLKDIDNLQVGQKIDLSKLFESHPRLGEIIRDANTLSADKLASIFKHDQTIAEFHHLHPNVPITSENVDQIAAGHGDAFLKKAVEQAANQLKEKSIFDLGEKIKDLEHSGVSGDDLEKLIIKDIKDLTEDQLSQIKNYTANLELLKKIGISQEDLDKLTVDDIGSFSAEQIKEISSKGVK